MFVLVSLAALGFLVIIALQVFSFASNTVSELVPEVTARNGPVTAKWAWNNGANKPQIQLGDETIVEISGWQSYITVNDGEPVALWDHYMGVNAIGGWMYATYSRPNEYLLEQQIVLRDDNTATIQYFFTPYQPVNSVELRLGHFKWWWNDASADGSVFEGSNNSLWTRITFGSFFRSVDMDDSRGRVNLFDAYYRATNVRERTLIAAEAIEFGKP
jgi:hypothetical protein